MPNRMTPAQRAKTVYRGEKPDRIPFTVYESKVVGKPYEQEVRANDVCLLRRIVSGQIMTPHVKKKQQTSLTPEGHRRSQTFLETPYGTLRSATEVADKLDIDTSWNKERLFKSAEDYRKLMFYFQDMTIVKNDTAIADAARLDQENGDVLVRDTIGLEPMQELISSIMGVETFCYEWMDNRDEMEKLLAVMSERALEKAAIVAATPLSMANYGGNVTPQIIGREAFMEHYMARYADAYPFFQQAGKLMGVHLDGSNAPIMDLIAQSKMDYVEAYDPSMSPPVHEAMRMFPDKILSINWPSARQLGTRGQIMQATTDILAEVTDFNRFIMGITEDIPSWKFAENIKAIADALAQWGDLS